MYLVDFLCHFFDEEDIPKLIRFKNMFRSLRSRKIKIKVLV